MIEIYPSKISGRLNLPASKSEFIRFLFATFLSKQTIKFNNINLCDDVVFALEFFKNLGATIEIKENALLFSASKKNKYCSKYNVGESAFLARMTPFFLLLKSENFEINGSGTLLKREMTSLVDLLRKSNIKVIFLKKENFLPLKIEGKLKSGKFFVDGSKTSQVLSGLLFILPLLNGNSEIFVENLKSIPYIKMTLDILKQFSIEIEHKNFQYFKIKGNQNYFFNKKSVDFFADWSIVANFLVLGALLGDLTIDNIFQKSLHSDKKILEVLTKSGVNFSVSNHSIFIKKSKNIKPFSFDASNSPDLVVPIAILASFALGKSEIFGINRLKYKESNRAEVLKEELEKSGVVVNLFENKMEIIGTRNFSSAKFFSHNDHRIAMALTILSLALGKKTELDGEKSVSKSFPEFFDAIKSLGGIIK